jgi:hypothetical protein
MGITAISGPQVVYGVAQTSTGGTQEYNEERGPSLFDLGQATGDPRFYFNYDPGSPVGTQVKGFYGQRAQVDYIPYGISSCAISQSSGTVPTAGTALTLAPLSTLGAFATTIIAPETGKSVSVVAIDSTAAVLTFGSGGTVALWNPQAGTGRAISITTSSSGDVVAGNGYTVFGRDMYGIKMEETILASTVTATGVGKKAFKYISQIIASTTVTSTGVGIGFIDTFGFPLRFNYVTPDVVISFSTNYQSAMTAATASSSTTTTASTATQTSTTGDVRGTWASTIATTGTSATIATGGAVRVYCSQNITATMASNITFTDTTAMFGNAQFSSI